MGLYTIKRDNVVMVREDHVLAKVYALCVGHVTH